MCTQTELFLYFVWSWGIPDSKPCQLPELGDLGAIPLGGSHNSWGAGCVNKLLPGRGWRLHFAVGVSWGETAGDVATSSIRLVGDPSQL